MILTVIIVYLTLVLCIGLFSHRLFRKTGEDYFVASRSIGPFVLLMSLFGTNMTAFAILGASAESYRSGIGVFSLMASASALVIPTIFFFIGTKLWKLGKREGYLTQIQFFRDRFESSFLGLLMFVVLVGLLIPYLLIGVIGAGLTLSQITGQQVPFWVGSLGICGVIFFYVTYSGMRGTAWVNTFQAVVFMSLGAVATLVILNKSGGLGNVMAHLAENNPELLIRGDKIPPMYQLSYLLIPLSAGMFPHMFTHWLTAKKVSNFKYPIVFYPICMIIVWVPSVLLGVTGHLAFPDLSGPATNGILVKLVDLHASGLLGGLLAAGVIAAIMSSLDSQVLTLGNMFTQDIVGHYKIGGAMDETKQVWWGRAFVMIILAITFLLSQVTGTGIFALGIWSFTGFASLLPITLAALYWKRSTKWGVFAAIATVSVLWCFFYLQGSKTVGDVMVVAIILPCSAAALVIGSLLTKPPASAARFFSE